VVGAQHDLPSVRLWHRNPVVIVGDAAHAVSTSSGQGANMAMESAVTLARCLRDCSAPEEAFTTYERLRRERVERIIAYGAKSAHWKAAGPVAAFLRDTFMHIGLTYFYKAESDAWLFRHHIDWNTPVGREAPAMPHEPRTSSASVQSRTAAHVQLRSTAVPPSVDPSQSGYLRRPGYPL
jgi:hypothetical protein